MKVFLFDADGVIQRVPASRDAELAKVANSSINVPDFLSQIFGAEKPCLVGIGDFVTNMSSLLEKWKADISIDGFMRLWNLIEPDYEILDYVTELRNRFRVCLATNQEMSRASHMATALRYDQVFDHSFYSCDLGVAKPCTEYFVTILEHVDVLGEEVVFIDDREENVAAAKSVGLCGETFHIAEGVDVLREKLKKYSISTALM